MTSIDQQLHDALAGDEKARRSLMMIRDKQNKSQGLISNSNQSIQRSYSELKYRNSGSLYSNIDQRTMYASPTLSLIKSNRSHSVSHHETGLGLALSKNRSKTSPTLDNPRPRPKTSHDMINRKGNKMEEDQVTDKIVTRKGNQRVDDIHNTLPSFPKSQSTLLSKRNLEKKRVPSRRSSSTMGYRYDRLSRNESPLNNRNRPATSAGVYEIDQKQRQIGRRSIGKEVIPLKGNTLETTEGQEKVKGSQDMANGSEFSDINSDISSNYVSTNDILKFGVLSPRSDTSHIDLKLPQPSQKSYRTILEDASTNISSFTQGLNIVVSNWVETLENNSDRNNSDKVARRKVETLSQKVFLDRIGGSKHNISSLKNSLLPRRSDMTPFDGNSQISPNVDIADIVRNKINEFHVIYHEQRDEDDSTSYSSESSKRKIEKGSIFYKEETKKLHEFKPRSEKEFKQKIDEMRQYNWKLKEFEKKIKQYKEEEKQRRKLQKAAQKTDFVRNHIKACGKEDYSHDILKENKRKRLEYHTDHMETVKERKFLIDKEKFERSQKNHNVKLMKLEEANKERQFYPTKKKLVKKQRVMLPMVVIATLFQKVDDVLLSIYQERLKFEREENAIRILQTKLFPLFLRKREEKRLEARQIILRQKLKWIINFRVRRKKKALRLIIQFLEDSKSASFVVNTVTSYMKNVRLCQQRVREHLLLRRSQLAVLSRQWDTVEADVVRIQFEKDMLELRYNIIEQLQNLTTKVKACTLKADQRIVRGTKTNQLHHKSNKRSTDFKKMLISSKETIVMGFREKNLIIPNTRKRTFVDTKLIIEALKDSSRYPNKQIHDILVSCATILNISVTSRAKSTDPLIKYRILKETLHQRVKMHYLRISQGQQLEITESNSSEVLANNSTFITQSASMAETSSTNRRFKFLYDRELLEALVLQGLEETLVLILERTKLEDLDHEFE